MSEIKAYLNKLKKIYGNSIEVTPSTYKPENLALVPQLLREFYTEYSKINLPFGCIYNIETAIKRSQAEPFKSEGWFCFGFDGYFSFWLCRFEPNAENLSITYWDHESGCKIDEPIYESLLDFLKDMNTEYEENKANYEDDWE